MHTDTENRYADLLDKERPRHENDDFSRRHPPMPLEERAKIFLPFAALKGYEETVARKEILYDRRMDLSEDMMEEINAGIGELRRILASGHMPQVKLRCFFPSEEGGANAGHEVWLEDQCRDVRETEQVLLLQEQAVPFSALREIRIVETGT